MKRFFKSVVSIALALVVFIGCKKDEEENTSEVTEAKAVENLVVADEKINTKIEEVSSNEIVFTGTELPKNIEKGGYIASSVTQEAPSGYLRKILDTRQENGKTYLVTENASLEDVIENGSYSFQKAFSPNDIKSDDINGLKVRGLIQETAFNFEKEIVLFDRDGKLDTKNDQITASGSAQLNFSVEKMDVEISFFRLKKFEVATKIEAKGNLKLNGEVGKSFEKEVEIKKWHLKPIEFVVSGVPVVIDHYISIKINAQGEIKASLDYGVELSGSIVSGMGYYRGEGWKPIQRLEKEFTYTPLDLTGEASVRVEEQIRYGFSPYGVVESGITLIPYAGAEATLKNLTELSTEVKAGIDLVLDASLVGTLTRLLVSAQEAEELTWRKNINLEEISLFKGEVSLAKIPALDIDKTSLSLQQGTSQEITITRGSGNYTFSVAPDKVVSVERIDKRIIVRGIATGNATITLTDTQSGQTKTINVTVTAAIPNLALAQTTASVELGKSQNISISSGSGSYEVTSANGTIASAVEVRGIVNITAKATGTTTVTVKDTQSGQTQTISVTVTAPIAQLPQGVEVENGVLKKWPCDKIPNDGRVIIPNGITSIGDRAFFNCSNLKEITFPNTLTRIGDNAFDKCTSLLSVALPNSLTHIGSFAFASCSSLSSIIIPNSVTYLGRYAFSGCTSATSISISSGLRTIEDGAFSLSKSVTSIVIPTGVIHIGNSAFFKCENLERIVIPNTVTIFGDRSFEECKKLQAITIPNGTTKIGSSAFKRCESLASFDLPNTITEIGEYAFQGTAITSIILPNSTSKIPKGAFHSCKQLTTITIPAGVNALEDAAFADCISLKDLNVLPYSINLIGDNTFAGCTGLERIELPSSVKSIGENAFGNCSNLTTVTLPNSIVNVGKLAFRRCNKLTTLRIGNQTPPFINNYSIGYTGKLVVPRGAKQAYEKANTWKDCSPIEEDDSLGGQYFGSFTTNADNLQIYCRDYAAIDGDMVDIIVNGELVISNVRLGRNYSDYTIALKQGVNKIEILALNVGSSSPNTAEFSLREDRGKLLITEKWDLLTGYKALFVVVKN